MAFEQLGPRRVLAFRSGHNSIRFSISRGLVQTLDLRQGSKIEALIGTEEDAGFLLVRRRHHGRYTAFRAGRQVAINIPAKFIGCALPQSSVLCDHHLTDDGIRIDITKLPKGERV